MPKSTHFHVVKDAVTTDKKFRPEDDGLYQKEKQEFSASEQAKKSDARTEQEFISEQDDKTEAKNGEGSEK